MIQNLLIAVGVAGFACWVSGARTLAYLAYFLSFVPFFTLDASTGGLDEMSGLAGGNVLFKMLTRLACTGLYVALLLRRPEVLRELFRRASLPVVGYVLWSLVWLHRSQIPWISLFRLGELLAFYLAGMALYLEAGRFHRVREVVRWHALGFLTLQLVVLWFAQTEPLLAYHVDSSGLKRMGHKLLEANSLGLAAAIGVLWSVHELREGREQRRHVFFERIVPLAVLGVSSYMVVLARSRTAMVTLLLAMGLLWLPYYTRDPRRRAAFVAFLGVAGALALLQYQALYEWFLRGQDAATLASGTGRTGLWSALLTEQVPSDPVGGAGYLMLSREGYFMHAGHWWTNAHNSYLFALVSTGIPGFLLVLGIVLVPLLANLRNCFLAPHEERPSWNLFLALQLVVLVASVTHFGISGHPNPAMMFHYCAYPFLALTRVEGTLPGAVRGRAGGPSPRPVMPVAGGAEGGVA